MQQLNGKKVAILWTLIDADVARGRKMTAYETIQTDLKNAGARWEDREVVRDGNLVTSRKPDDIPAFNREMIEMFAEVGQMETVGRHE
jgi:protease I